MKVKLSYQTQTHGTKQERNEHVTSVWRSHKRVTILLDHIEPMLDPKQPNPKSLELTLSEAEALRIASAILYQVHLPNHEKQTVSWDAVTGLPLLSQKIWDPKVSVSFVPQENCFEVMNSTPLAVGILGLLVTLSAQGAEKKGRTQVASLRLTANVCPGETKLIAYEPFALKPAFPHGGSKPIDAQIQFITAMRD